MLNQVIRSHRAKLGAEKLLIRIYLSSPSPFYKSSLIISRSVKFLSFTLEEAFRISDHVIGSAKSWPIHSRLLDGWMACPAKTSYEGGICTKLRSCQISAKLHYPVNNSFLQALVLDLLMPHFSHFVLKFFQTICLLFQIPLKFLYFYLEFSIFKFQNIYFLSHCFIFFNLLYFFFVIWVCCLILLFHFLHQPITSHMLFIAISSAALRPVFTFTTFIANFSFRH